MVNKEIQEERMRSYFIDSAKEILKGEGLKNISVRNIAERAGYSYATLYNYFKDVKDLIFECVKDFQDECTALVQKDSKKAEQGFQKIKVITQSYIKYFVQYPGIFELFYIEKTNEIAGKKQPTVEMIYSFLDRLCEEEWNYLTENNLITIDEKELMSSSLRYTVLGILILYLTRKHPANYKEFLKISEIQINNILKIK